jgi:eukaryotic-like serine/threonine-protein kinase
LATVAQHTNRWERLEALFAEAIELPRAGRAGFVESETGSDPELRTQLRALLAHDAGAGGRIAEVIAGMAKDAALPGGWPGQHFGPYRIVREIGRGGMGLVFLAVRDDDEYRKTVALKIAPWWRDLDLLRERFRHERQILAGLEHPNIARFLDGGTQDGIPYFAMEFVEGCPITEYASRRGLKLRDRIELFRQVCAAVHYAHQNLLVHRDLKPGNILVNHDGAPKLLDFGIAKLLSPLPDAHQDTLTGTSPWTPDYASPEQVRARPITTRTDVYSLGLILFELLTGERGQKAETSSPLALDRSICEMELPLASMRAAALGGPALSRQLRGDLDTIIAMAVSKEPERRYGTAAALRDDLGRYLKGLPVEARPGTLAYRAGKLVRRHRVGVAAGLLLAASIAGGVAATIHQARRAERRFQQVRKLANAMLFDVQDKLQNLAGATEARETAVRVALGYLDDLSKDAGQDKSLGLELAAAYLKIGDVQGYPVLPSLGHRDAALESYQKARGIAGRLTAGDNDPKVRRLLARSYQRVAAMLRALGRIGAIEEYRRGLAVADSLYAVAPDDAENSEVLVTILISLGQAEAAAGNVAEASRLWLRSAEMSRRSPVQNPRNPERSQLGQTHQTVIRALMYAGDLERAEQTAREGIRAREALAAGQPANAALRRSLMNAYLEMAYVFFHPNFLSFGDGQTALVFHRKALAIAHELAASDPSNQTAQSDLALAEAEACAAQNGIDPAQGIEYCRAALATAAGWPTQLNTEEMWASLADGLQRLGRYPEALAALRKAIEFRESMVQRDPWRFAVRQRLLRAYNQMAALRLDMGDAAGAIESHRRALALAEELASAIPSNLLARRDLADTYEGLGKYYEGRDWHEARAWHQKSLDIWIAWPGIAISGRMDQARRLSAEQAVARCGRGT